MAPREEEKAMEGLLRRKLARGAHSAGVCPEPDLLAAYFERSMDADEIERHELHFSECARCRQQLAAMARASAAGEAGARAGMDIPAAGSSWAWLWDWRLLAPAAAVLAFAIVATMWMRGGREIVREAVSVPPSAPPVALDKKEALPSTELPPSLDKKTQPQPQTQPMVLPKAAAGKPADTPSLKTEPKDSRALGRNSLALRPSSHGATSAPSAARARALTDALASAMGNAARQQQQLPASSKGAATQGMKEAVEVESSAPALVPSPAPEPPPAPTKLAAGASTPTQPPAGASGSIESSTVQNAETSVMITDGNEKSESETRDSGKKSKKSKKQDKPAADELDSARIKSYSQAVTVAGQPGPITILTPDPAILWRFAGSGFVERSTDGGATWQGEEAAEGAVLVAGAAPSVDVCWLVGRDGLILMTKDAKTWKKIAPPVEGDFIAVSAESAPKATVTAADGRKFSTNNGGKKWKPAE